MHFWGSGIRVFFADNFGWVRFLAVYFLYKTDPNARKKTKIAVGKKVGPKMPLFDRFFLGLGWPWVGKFVGFIKICMFFNPTEHGKTANTLLATYLLYWVKQLTPLTGPLCDRDGTPVLYRRP